MVINEGLARRLFPGGNAVGERLVVDFGKPFRAEIVGVVSDVRIYGQANEVPDLMYFSIHQPGAGFGAPPGAACGPRPGRPDSHRARRSARYSASSILMCRSRRWRRWRTILSGSVAAPRFRTGLLVGFAAVALPPGGDRPVRDTRLLGHAAVARARDSHGARRAIDRGIPPGSSAGDAAGGARRRVGPCRLVRRHAASFRACCSTSPAPTRTCSSL